MIPVVPNASARSKTPAVRIIRRAMPQDARSTELRVGVYIRSSTLSQVNSEARQRLFAESLAHRLGTLVEVFTDIGKTGATLVGRQAMAHAVDAAKAKRINVLVIDNVTRMGRDTADVLTLYKRLNHYGCQIYETSAGRRLTFIEIAIKGIGAQLDKAKFAKETSDGRDLAVHQGRSPHRNRFGFSIDHGNPQRGYRTRHVERAKAVIEIFERYAGGTGAAEIARSLTGRHPTPSDASRFDCRRDEVEGRSAWTSNMIISIIRCPLYKGKLIDRRTTTVRDPDDYNKKSFEPNDPKNFKRGEIGDPANYLVSDELWYWANSAVAVRRKNRSSGDNGARHLLTGRVRCAACSATLASVLSSGHRMYRCVACHEAGRPAVRARVAWVERCVLEALRDQVFGTDELDRFMQSLSAIREARNIDRDRRERQLNTEIEITTKRIRSSFDIVFDADEMVEEGRLRMKGEARLRHELEGELESLEHELRNLPRRSAAVERGDAQALDKGIGAMLAALPFRPTADENPDSYPGGASDPALARAHRHNSTALKLIRLTREIVASVEVSPVMDSGAINVSIKVTLVAPTDDAVTPAPDTQVTVTAFIEQEVERVKDLATRDAVRSQVLDGFADDARNRIPDAVWAEMAPHVDKLEQTIAGSGWQAKSLVEALCFRARTRIRLSHIPAVFGPPATFLATAKALTSESWRKLAPVLQEHCPTILEGAATALLPKPLTDRASPPAGKGRRKAYATDPVVAAHLEALATAQVDAAARQRLAIVAMHLRGVPVAEIARVHGVRTNRASDLTWKFRRRGLAALGVTYVAASTSSEPTAGTTSAASLRNFARKADCPDLEAAFEALALVAEKKGLRKAASDAGIGRKQFDKWRDTLKDGGPMALAASPWPYRNSDIAVSRRFQALAAELRAEADAASGIFLRAGLLAVTLYMGGTKAATIAEVTEFDSRTLRAVLDGYRERGVNGITAVLSGPRDPSAEDLSKAGDLQEQADHAIDFAQKRRLRAVADCLRGEARRVIGIKFGISADLIVHWLSLFRRHGVEGIAPKAPVGRLSDTVIARLRDIVANGTDPEDTDEPITLPRLRQICEDEYCLWISHDVLRKCLFRHGIRLGDVPLRKESRIERSLGIDFDKAPGNP